MVVARIDDPGGASAGAFTYFCAKRFRSAMRPRIAFTERDILPKRREDAPHSKAPRLRGENLFLLSWFPDSLLVYAGRNSFNLVTKYSIDISRQRGDCG
jgi:hypothetical protein